MAVAAFACLALVAAACSGGSASNDSASEGPGATVSDGGEPAASDDVATTDAPAVTDAPVISEGQIIQDVVEDVGEETGPIPGGTLRFALEADVDGLNPTTSSLSAPGRMMALAVFDTLTTLDVDGNIVPYLAESVEPIDGDLTRWSVVVREGITFHDGTPLTAQAVQANFDAQLASFLPGCRRSSAWSRHRSGSQRPPKIRR